MSDVRKTFAGHYHEIQKTQWRKSLLLFVILFAFYYVLLGFVTLVCILGLGLFIPGIGLPGGAGWPSFLGIIGIIAVGVAAFHFYDARRHGAVFIRGRLLAASPDPGDRYHQQFANTVEEIRLAAGLPRVTPFVLPAFAVNSMALIEPDGSPSILVTEGMLAEFTRDELQAVTAHELAHVIRGDTFYVTLVCSLANVFERMRQASEPDQGVPVKPGEPRDTGGGHPLLWMASTISVLIMHLLGSLISRQRELLADAAAVELSRAPAAMARAIYKAHIQNSFIGDFSQTYSPLFIVPPYSRCGGEGAISRIFNTHPPLMKRIRRLADMIPTPPARIIQEVLETRKQRSGARLMITAQDERNGTGEDAGGHPAPLPGAERLWAARGPRGRWEGPLNLAEVLGLRYFAPGLRVKNLQEDIEAPAREFPQIRAGLRNQYLKRPIHPRHKGKCPRCRIPLRESRYEGIAVMSCGRCGGKLIDTPLIDRVIARREVAFSDRLLARAEDFRNTYMANPAGTRKLSKERSPAAFCPGCGSRMLPRPFNYQYIVPVDKCLSCHKTWFDGDELEILQILIEER